jgi:hypothetical protein
MIAALPGRFSFAVFCSCRYSRFKALLSRFLFALYTNRVTPSKRLLARFCPFVDGFAARFLLKK